MIDRTAQSPRTVIDVGSEVYGPLRARGILEIHGRVAGPIEHDGTLLIARGGRCEGQVQATEIVIAGEARGEVTVTGRLQIEATGRLIGDAVYGTLVVAAGGLFHGRIRRHESAEQMPVPAHTSDPAMLHTPEPARVPEPALYHETERPRFIASTPPDLIASEPPSVLAAGELDSAGQPAARNSAIQTIRSPLPDEAPQPKPHWGVALLRAARLRSRKALDRMA